MRSDSRGPQASAGQRAPERVRPDVASASAQKAQRWIRRRPLCQLLRRLQEAPRIALLARRQRLVVERHRVGESRSGTEDQQSRDHCVHHSA